MTSKCLTEEPVVYPFYCKCKWYIASFVLAGGRLQLNISQFSYQWSHLQHARVNCSCQFGKTTASGWTKNAGLKVGFTGRFIYRRELMRLFCLLVYLWRHTFSCLRELPLLWFLLCLVTGKPLTSLPYFSHRVNLLGKEADVVPVRLGKCRRGGELSLLNEKVLRCKLFPSSFVVCVLIFWCVCYKLIKKFLFTFKLLQTFSCGAKLGHQCDR